MDSKEFYLHYLSNQLHNLIDFKPSERVYIMEDLAEDPSATPMFWISKWVDCSDKYGLGYQLCDNSIGVLFNDTTKIVLMADQINMHYIERDGTKHHYQLDTCPIELYRKKRLLEYFKNYMNEYLIKSGAKPESCDDHDLVRIPHLHNWFRTSNSIVFQLTNGTVQVNFCEDHTKLIVCPLKRAVTIMNDKNDFTTYRIDLMEKYGCSREVFSRVRYTSKVVDRLIDHKLGSNTRSGKP